MRTFIPSKPASPASAKTALLTALLVAAPLLVWSQEAISPYVQITADGREYNVPLKGDGKLYQFGDVFETPEFQIQISGTLNPDPSIAYGIAVTDFGAPSTFGFLFFTPIVPTGPLTTVSGSIVGGLTDATGDGVSLTPTGAKAQTSDVYFPMTTMGVDVGDPAAYGPGPSGAFYSYGSYAEGPDPGPSGGWTALSVTTSFTLSGGGDIAALTGYAEVTTASSVPEGGLGILWIPTVLGLLVAGKRAAAGRRISG